MAFQQGRICSSPAKGTNGNQCMQAPISRPVSSGHQGHWARSSCCSSQPRHCWNNKPRPQPIPPQQTCAEGAEIFPQVAGPDVGKPLQRSPAGSTDAIEGGKPGNTAEAAGQPAVEEGLLAIVPDHRPDHSTPQQWSSEQGEAPCHRCLLQLLVTTTPDSLADQGGHAAHQGLRPDASSPDLGQRRSEDRPRASSRFGAWSGSRRSCRVSSSSGSNVVGPRRCSSASIEAAAAADQQRPAQREGCDPSPRAPDLPRAVGSSRRSIPITTATPAPLRAPVSRAIRLRRRRVTSAGRWRIQR